MIYELLLKYVLILIIIYTLFIYNWNRYKSDYKNDIKELFIDSEVNCKKKCKKKHDKGSKNYKKCKKKCKRKNEKNVVIDNQVISDNDMLIDDEPVLETDTDNTSFNNDYINNINITSSINDIVDNEIDKFRKDIPGYPIEEIEGLERKNISKGIDDSKLKINYDYWELQLIKKISCLRSKNKKMYV